MRPRSSTHSRPELRTKASTKALAATRKRHRVPACTSTFVSTTSLLRALVTTSCGGFCEPKGLAQSLLEEILWPILWRNRTVLRDRKQFHRLPRPLGRDVVQSDVGCGDFRLRDKPAEAHDQMFAVGLDDQTVAPLGYVNEQVREKALKPGVQVDFGLLSYHQTVARRQTLHQEWKNLRHADSA